MVEHNILYHGTNQTYLDMQVEKHGCYMHDRGQVYTTQDFNWARNRADTTSWQSRQRQEPPIVLVIDTSKVPGGFELEPSGGRNNKFLTDELPVDSYKVVKIYPGRNYETERDLQAILEEMGVE